MCKKNAMKKMRLGEAARIVKLSHEYNGLWEVITDKDSRYMNPAMLRRLVRFLESNELYEMIYIMLSVHKDKTYVKTAYDLMLKDSILKEIEEGRNDRVIQSLLQYLS